MSFLSRLTKAKFDDSEIVSRAMKAIEEDPIVENAGQVVIASKDGVVTLTGAASTETAKAHIESVVLSAIRMSGLKCGEVVNEITVSQ